MPLNARIITCTRRNSSNAKYNKMDDAVVQQIVALNHRFYTQHGEDFAATRRRIQPGVRQILSKLPDIGTWLDVGCGSGNLASAWVDARRSSTYCGVDFSAKLLEEAQKWVNASTSQKGVGNLAISTITFHLVDLTDASWTENLKSPFYGSFAFAVLHHIPSQALRQRVLRQVRGLLKPGSFFYHSVWQFQHAPKLIARIQPWELAGLEDAQIEPGDTLLDWRAPTAASAALSANEPALRYIHLFTHAELDTLAQDCGFTVRETFESDGAGGRLGLYQKWEAI